ncbi:hypothetical protein TrLO_g11350 [Triparma laevis f. longispina]|uniref:SET domain-containing protein n=1 Tax=Triparma laevis f. longispina TaxID=1714387 RepID=A0A9W7F1K9_9STRA|nr:hypothetical protein TrLO_g11350 [Triparma laevis f. longispina]
MAACLETPPLVIPSHLELISSTNAGRNLVTCTRAAAGTVVLNALAFCHVIHQRFRKHTCDACYAFTSIDGRDLPFPCEGTCGVHYCSSVCRDAKKARHSKVCSLTNLGSKSRSKSSKKSDKTLETGINLLLSAISNDVPLSYLVNQLGEDDESISTPGKSKRLSSYTSAEVSLRKLLPCPLPQGSYSKALSTSHFNAVGLYDEYGSETGYLLSPLMALVNHSCLPNCCQVVENGRVFLKALRDIEVGEELSYSYVSIGLDSDRRKSILDNWGFTCGCYRCRIEIQSGEKTTNSELETFDERHVCCCGAVSFEVERNRGGEGEEEDCVCHIAGIIM